MTNENSIDDKLYTVKFKSDDKSHLIADVNKCRCCCDKVCLYICPANVYSWNQEEDTLEIAYENCLECSACKVACPLNSIVWNYPKGGCGITYKYS